MEAALRRWDRLELFSAVWPVVNGALVDLMPHLAVPLMVHHRADRTIDRQLLPIDTQPRDLSVEIREVATLEERVVAEANTGDDVRGAESDLFDLREVLVNIAVQDHLAYNFERNKFFRPNLSSIEDVEVEVMLLSFGDCLNGELPLGECAICNGLLQILAMEI